MNRSNVVAGPNFFRETARRIVRGRHPYDDIPAKGFWRYPQPFSPVADLGLLPSLSSEKRNGHYRYSVNKQNEWRRIL
jgi:hypothetical protein